VQREEQLQPARSECNGSSNYASLLRKSSDITLRVVSTREVKVGGVRLNRATSGKMEVHKYQVAQGQEFAGRRARKGGPEAVWICCSWLGWMVQYDSAEWELTFLRQAREFPFLPLLPREATK